MRCKPDAYSAAVWPFFGSGVSDHKEHVVCGSCRRNVKGLVMACRCPRQLKMPHRSQSGSSRAVDTKASIVAYGPQVVCSKAFCRYSREKLVPDYLL